jgi:hypothetical protein
MEIINLNTEEAIRIGSDNLRLLSGHIFNLLEITKPDSSEAAVNLSKVISKLSPILGNMIEFNIVEFLNTIDDFSPHGTWIRQDPGFPDALFSGNIDPAPGFEIKAWFPLSTEITARFKDSLNHFQHDQTYVALIAWLPEYLLFGKPKVIDVCIVSGKSVALARDSHYHNPPDYLVLEPEDTTGRTANLQQTNTNGYKWQDSPENKQEALLLVQSWIGNGGTYSPSPEYQLLLRDLLRRYNYRSDTNFAKIDRIVHSGIEEFKTRVLDTQFHGHSIREWFRILYKYDTAILINELRDRFGIGAP